MHVRMSLAAAISALTLSTPALADTVRVSVTSAGGQLSKDSQAFGISGNGRYVSFTADSPELGCSNSEDQAFIYDSETGNVTLISESTSGGVSNDYSFASRLSYDGLHAVFASSSTDLISGFSSSVRNIYVRDIEAGTTTVVSVNGSGTAGNANSGGADISGDGNIVAFDSFASNLATSDTNASRDVFVKNMTSGDLTLISRTTSSEGNGNSNNPSISADGRVVAFISSATNLVASDTNSTEDAFVYNFETDTLERVSISTAGVEANGKTWDVDISANGRYVVFSSSATNLVSGDTEGQRDVFIRDLKNDTTTRVSTTSAGAGFAGGSYAPSVSADGRFVAFDNGSASEREVPGSGKDIYLKDMETGDVSQIDIGLNDTSYNDSYGAHVDYTAKKIAYSSAITNLVASDTNAKIDAFLTDITDLICE